MGCSELQPISWQTTRHVPDIAQHAVEQFRPETVLRLQSGRASCSRGPCTGYFGSLHTCKETLDRTKSCMAACPTGPMTPDMTPHTAAPEARTREPGGQVLGPSVPQAVDLQVEVPEGALLLQSPAQGCCPLCAYAIVAQVGVCTPAGWPQCSALHPALQEGSVQMSLDASSEYAWGPSLDPCSSSSPRQCSRPCTAVTAHRSRSAHPRALRPPLGMHSKRSQEQHALEEVLRGLHSACFQAGASAHGVILLCFHNRFLAPGPDQGQGALSSGMHAFHAPVLSDLRVLSL